MKFEDKLWSYFDSFQSTFFNQKQRDLFPRRAWQAGVAFALLGLLAYWVSRRVPEKEALPEPERHVA